MKRAPFDIVREVFHADENGLDEDFDLRNLSGWDSLNHMTFVAELEKEYEITLTGDEIAEMLNLGRITRILKKNHSVPL